MENKNKNFKNKIFHLWVILLLLILTSSIVLSDSSEIVNNFTDFVALSDLDINSSYIEDLDIYFFWSESCPACARQKPFMDELENKYTRLNIKKYEVSRNSENRELFLEVSSSYGIRPRGVPTTFIGDKSWVGYSDQFGLEMINKIDSCFDSGCDVLYYKESLEESDEESNNEKISEYPSDEEKGVCLHVFIDYNCPACNKTKIYLDSIDLKGVNLIYHDVTEPGKEELYQTFKDIYGLPQAGFPVVFIGDYYFLGYTQIVSNIEDQINKCQSLDACPCPVNRIKGITPSMPQSSDYKSESSSYLDLPLVGEVYLGEMPLFLTTFLISFIDGFNPCSLWLLMFLMGIVIYTGCRKKIFLVGFTFLFITASAYGAFILGMLNVFTYIGHLTLIKVIVALVALTFAIINIKDYFWYKIGISLTISDKHKPSLFKKVRNIMNPSKSLGSMILATIVMALGVVLVELPCTAGFPIIWTSIMAENNISGTLFLAHFLLYLFIYLLIEMIFFTFAVITLKANHFEEKHGRILKLVGGIIMLFLAYGMVFLSEAMNTLRGSLYLFGSAGITTIIIIYLHRKLLPRFGVVIGTEEISRENTDEKQYVEKNEENNNSKPSNETKHDEKQDSEDKHIEDKHIEDKQGNKKE